MPFEFARPMYLASFWKSND